MKNTRYRYHSKPAKSLAEPGAGPLMAAQPLKEQLQGELDLSGSRGGTSNYARRGRRNSVRAAEDSSVWVSKVGPVGNIEKFRPKLQRRLLTDGRILQQ